MHHTKFGWTTPEWRLRTDRTVTREEGSDIVTVQVLVPYSGDYDEALLLKALDSLLFPKQVVIDITKQHISGREIRQCSGDDKYFNFWLIVTIKLGKDKKCYITI